MPNLLLDLEIDAACWEFLSVIYLDAMPDEPQRDDDPDPWDELTAKAARYGTGPETTLEMTERLCARMDG